MTESVANQPLANGPGASDGGTAGGDLPALATALFEAVMAISSDLDLHNVLGRIVEAATMLTDARYGALGVVGPEEDLVEFVTTGLDVAARARIGDLPHGRGILGLLISDPRPIRIKDLTEHPRSYGFPANHPPMGSFLGVPVRIRGTVFGNLYLTEKAGGAEFTRTDEELVVGLAGVAGLVIENARAYGLSERRREWLEAAAALPDTLQPPIDWGDALTQVAELSRRVGRAEATAIVDLTTSTVLAMSAEPAAEEQTRRQLAEVLAEVPDLGLADPVDVSLGHLTATVLPLRTQLAPGGLLVSLYDADRMRLRDIDDRDLLRSFADYAALTLDRRQAIAEREELAVISDRERIARDLHDVVIQRLFATGMQLQAAALRAEKDDVRELIEGSVADLDATIRDVRATIFELQTPSAGSLRGELRALVREYARVLGFTPALWIRGPVDTAATPGMREAVLKVLREALSNVSRHARAGRVEVVVAAEEGRLALSVDDDGVGLQTPGTGSGLDNARSRAGVLGGELRLGSSALGGTRLHWSVPLQQ